MGIVERKEREKAERRRSILEAARELIQEKTFEEITMEDLAKRLELSRATLYLYFRNKSEIYTTLLIEGMRDLEGGYGEVLARGPLAPLEKLTAFAFVFFQFYQTNHHFFDLIVTKRDELRKDIGDEVLADLEKAGDSVIRPLVNIIEEGAEKGEFPDGPPEKMAWLLRAVAIGFAVGIREGKIKFPEDLALAQQLLLYGLKGHRSPDAD